MLSNTFYQLFGHCITQTIPFVSSLSVVLPPCCMSHKPKPQISGFSYSTFLLPGIGLLVWVDYLQILQFSVSFRQSNVHVHSGLVILGDSSLSEDFEIQDSSTMQSCLLELVACVLRSGREDTLLRRAEDSLKPRNVKGKHFHPYSMVQNKQHFLNQCK